MGCSGCGKGQEKYLDNQRRPTRYVPGEITGDGAFIRFTPEELDWIEAAFRNAPKPQGGLNESIFNKIKAGGLKDVGTFAEAGAIWDWVVSAIDGVIDIAEMLGTMSVPNSPTHEIHDLANRLQELAIRLDRAGLMRPSKRGDAPQVEEADGETDEEEGGNDQATDRRE